jgi:hypothetical protein
MGIASTQQGSTCNTACVLPPAFRMAVTATASVEPSMAPNSAASTGRQPASARLSPYVLRPDLAFDLFIYILVRLFCYFNSLLTCYYEMNFYIVF